ncbi:MAG: hypothetical protein Q8876_06865 [Bacillota bacterium]|nr:hypothetical protein [Bacillota bacterium]
MKTKKYTKIVAVFCSLILFISLGIVSQSTAYADSTQYHLSKLNMNISLPNDMYVVTADTSSNDPIFIYMLDSYSDIQKFFSDRNGYLYAESSDHKMSISIVMTNATIDNYNSADADTLNTVTSGFNQQKSIVKNSVQKTKTDNNVLFFQMQLQDKDSKGVTTYGIQYDTIVNGEKIDIIASSQPGKQLTSDEIQQVGDIASTVSFDVSSSVHSVTFGSVMLVIGIVVVIGFAIFLIYEAIKRKKRGYDTHYRKLTFSNNKANRMPEKTVSPFEEDEDFFGLGRGLTKTSAQNGRSAGTATVTRRPQTGKSQNLHTAQNTKNSQYKKNTQELGGFSGILQKIRNLAFFKHFGYFVFNIRKMMKSGKKPMKKQLPPQKKPVDRKPRNYDVFKDS